MAKKKELDPKKMGLEKMSLEKLNESLEFSEKEGATDAVELIKAEIEKRKKLLSKSEEIKKKFKSLSDYKEKIKFKEVNYKEQGWINMSPAFKDTIKQPGIPTGHVHMVYGLSDVGKTTLAVEAAANAQKQGILPIFIITENKFSKDRAAVMGLDPDSCIFHNDVDFIEEGCDLINKYLKEQEQGELPYDILFVWDSIGQTPSREEMNKVDNGEKGGMMVTSRVISERIKRNIAKKISSSRREDYPYTNTFIVVNHAYTKPPTPPSTISSLVAGGGEALWLSCSFVFRMGGVMSRSSKVTATKDGTTVSFAIRSAIKLEKNHINDLSAEGKIICTDHGFLLDDKTAIDNYKEEYRSGWNLEFDKYWNSVSLD